jgi:hypothetical protein
MITRPAKAIFLSLFASLALTACTSAPTAPSSTTTVATPVTDVFAGDLQVLGSNLYSLSLVQASTVNLVLASLTDSAGIPVSTRVGLALGTLDDAGVCTHLNEVFVTPALQAHLNVGTQAGSKCVEIRDTGSLSQPLNFAIRVTYTPVAGKPPTTTPAPGTDTFVSNIPLGGSASHAIPASQAGTIVVNISGLAPASAVIGVGLGIPRTTGAGCFLNRMINATTGSGPISAPVDLGTYCVRVFDSGLLRSPATFTLTTTYP